MSNNSFTLTDLERKQIDQKLLEISEKTKKQWTVNILAKGTSATTPHIHVYAEQKFVGTIDPEKMKGAGLQICSELDRLAAENPI